ncbi:MAG: hypothetical protein ACKOI0_01005 [Actinomycetota bacterium]
MATWTYLDGAGTAVGASESFPGRAEAEAWLTDHWPELLADGVLEVALVDDGAEVYRMLLTPEA